MRVETRYPKPLCQPKVWCGGEDAVAAARRGSLGAAPRPERPLGPSRPVAPGQPCTSPASSGPGRDASRCRSGHSAAKSAVTAREHSCVPSCGGSVSGDSGIHVAAERAGGATKTHTCRSLPACVGRPLVGPHSRSPVGETGLPHPEGSSCLDSLRRSFQGPQHDRFFLCHNRS